MEEVNNFVHFVPIGDIVYILTKSDNRTINDDAVSYSYFCCKESYKNEVLSAETFSVLLLSMGLVGGRGGA